MKKEKTEIANQQLSQREVLTPPMVAKKLGVSVGKVSAWIRSGELVAVNVATTRSLRPRWIIQAVALDAFLKSRQAVPDPPPPINRSTRRQIGKFRWM